MWVQQYNRVQLHTTNSEQEGCQNEVARTAVPQSTKVEN